MFRINHNDAIELEHQVRRLYKCDRAGVSGLADVNITVRQSRQSGVARATCPD